MNNPSSLRYTYAIQDFREARRKAAVQQVLARITGKSIDLLPFEEVRKKLKGNQKINRGLQEIPLDAIIGSVGRYADFTRSFLPRQDRDVDRWVKVKVQVAEKGWLPPIEVYQIGEAYFVLDGNHRVSIARTTGVPTIQAYVTEIRTKVPLSPDDQPDDLILKAELADFLDYTELNPAHADLRVTAPGNYRFLLRQITGIQRKRREEHGEKLSGDKASLTWFEKNYLPVVRIIRERGLLRDFPNRTETDLYVWMNKHRAKLEKTIGWEIEWEKAAYNLVSQASTKPKRVAARIGGKLYDALTPDPLESGPRPGQWRQDMLATHRKNRLFTGILVPVSGEEPGWLALEQALVLAKLEGDHLHGLHVVPTGEPRNSPRALGVKAEFERRIREAGIPGELVIESGKVARKICSSACWMDMVVLNISHPPDPQPAAKLASGLHTIIHRCCRPILIVPQVSQKIERLLLAYDDSPKAREALFIATYIAGKWNHQFDILTVIEDGREEKAAKAMLGTKNYLRARDVQGNFIIQNGRVADVILATADEQDSDMIIMGGYGFSPVLEVVLGSALDQVLRESRKPVLLCR